jgi:CRP-like cAMP-binding protein
MARKSNALPPQNFSAGRDDISALSGVSAESVSRNLTELRGERLIELQNGMMRILDEKKLRELKN